MKIHEIIRARRMKLGLTQEQLAGKLGVSAPAVNKWERGNSYPDITLLPVLARTLGVDLNTLLSFQEDLTDQEIGAFLNYLSETGRAEGCGAAFALAEEKLREFPGNDRLAYSAAGILSGAVTLWSEGAPPEEVSAWKETVRALYRRCAAAATPRSGRGPATPSSPGIWRTGTWRKPRPCCPRCRTPTGTNRSCCPTSAGSRGDMRMPGPSLSLIHI